MTIRLSTCLGACALAAAVSLSFVGTRATAAGVVVRVQDAKPAPTAQAPQRRFIVRYRTGTLQRSSATAALDAARAAVVRSGIATSIPGLTVRHVRRMSSGADVIALSRSLDAAASASLLSALAADPNVASVAPDRRLHHTGIAAPTFLPNDPLSQQYQWHFYNSVGGIKAPAAWDSANGTGVVVAVLDTGVTDHPDLVAEPVAGLRLHLRCLRFAPRDRRARARRARLRRLERRFHAVRDGQQQLPRHARGGHGGRGYRTTASAWPASRTARRCCRCACSVVAVVTPPTSPTRSCGLPAARCPASPANANPAEVINMSLGGQFLCEESMQAAIDTAVANGTTVVVSAGNSNANASEFAPASCNNVITVGASRITGGKAFYSNFGKKVDLSAPGGGGGQDAGAGGYVWQTVNDSATAPELGSPAYGGMSGTSMAAPHVAAVAALVQSKASTPLTPAQMEAMLKSTARRFPVTIPTNQPMGTGILDAKAALATVLPPCQGPDCESAARPLVNKVPAKNLAGAAGAQLSYVIDVPIGASALNFMTYGGTGDVTLLVRYAQVPTTDRLRLRVGACGQQRNDPRAGDARRPVLREGRRSQSLHRGDAGSAPQLIHGGSGGRIAQGRAPDTGAPDGTRNVPSGVALQDAGFHPSTGGCCELAKDNVVLDHARTSRRLQWRRQPRSRAENHGECAGAHCRQHRNDRRQGGQTCGAKSHQPIHGTQDRWPVATLQVQRFHRPGLPEPARIAHAGNCDPAHPDNANFAGNVIDVGTGMAITTLAQVAWESLPAHTMVRVHPKATPYNERIFIVTSDIKVCGIRDANGARPKISGLNARVRNSSALQSQIGTPAEEYSTVNRGIVAIARDSGIKNIAIEGLNLTATMSPPYSGDNHAASYIGMDNASHLYNSHTGCLYVSRAQNVTIRDNEFSFCPVGVYVISRGLDYGGDHYLTRNFMLEGNYFHDNGLVDDYNVHQAYIQGVNFVVQYNYFGNPIRWDIDNSGAIDNDEASNGNDLKMRTVGELVRYNYFENGAHSIDLIDVEDFRPSVFPWFFNLLADEDPSAVTPAARATMERDWMKYQFGSFMYGNIFRRDQKVHVQTMGASMVHFGSDNSPIDGRRGKLWFYFNTVVTSMNKNSSQGAATLFSCCLDNANSWDFYDGSSRARPQRRRLPHGRQRQGLRRGAAQDARGILGPLRRHQQRGPGDEREQRTVQRAALPLEYLQGRADRVAPQLRHQQLEPTIVDRLPDAGLRRQRSRARRVQLSGCA